MLNKSFVTKLVVAVVLVSGTIGVLAMKDKNTPAPVKNDRAVEVTEHVDEKSGQKYTRISPVGEPEPTYSEVKEEASEPQDEPSDQPIETPFDAKTYATNKLRDSLPAADNQKYMAWQLPCLEDLITKTIGWDITQAQVDQFFSDTSKYTSVCSALQIYKATGKY